MSSKRSAIDRIMENRRVESVGGDPMITRILGPGPFFEVLHSVSLVLSCPVLPCLMLCSVLHTCSHLSFYSEYLFSLCHCIQLLQALTSFSFPPILPPFLFPIMLMLCVCQSHEQEGKSKSGLFVKASEKFCDAIEDYTQMFCRRCYTYNCRYNTQSHAHSHTHIYIHE